MKTETLTNQAYNNIEHKIVTLVLEPSAYITEKKLCEMTEFGRMPVHNACIKLESVHLIRILPRKGMIVSPINWEEIFQQIELRRVIEPILMKYASKNALPHERETIRNFKEEWLQASDEGNVDITVKIDGQFNRFIYEIARNSFASQAMLPLWALARRMYYTNYHIDIDISRKIDMAHCNLMESISMCRLEKIHEQTVEIIDYVELLYKTAFTKNLNGIL